MAILHLPMKSNTFSDLQFNQSKVKILKTIRVEIVDFKLKYFMTVSKLAGMSAYATYLQMIWVYYIVINLLI